MLRLSNEYLNQFKRQSNQFKFLKSFLALNHFILKYKTQQTEK